MLKILILFLRIAEDAKTTKIGSEFVRSRNIGYPKWKQEK